MKPDIRIGYSLLDGSKNMTRSTDTTAAGTLDPSFAEGGILSLPTPEFAEFYVQAVLPLAGNQLLLGMRVLGAHEPIGVAKLKEDGSVDWEFGEAGTGLVEFSIKGHRLYVDQLCALNDGGWLVIGTYQTEGFGGRYVLRYFQDGQLDGSFGENGLRLLPFKDGHKGVEKTLRISGWGDGRYPVLGPRDPGRQGTAAVQQLDGKIVLLSHRYLEFGPAQRIVLRLNPDGSMDKTFNGAGFAVIELNNIAYDDLTADAVAVQADGKVIVSGSYFKASPASRGAYVTRLDSMGRLDSDFNGGVVTVPHANSIFVRDIAVKEADGRILVAGNARNNQAMNGILFVLTSGGFFDFNFNRGQPLFSMPLAQGQSWKCCTFQADGSILVAGTTGAGFVMEGTFALTARFLPDGSLDPTFNGVGFVTFDEKNQYESVETMAVMVDGRIVVGGFGWLDGPDWAYIGRGWIVRYLV
ncbi:hypothetical protein [Pseudomonas citrulli]|uniref:Delta-60 repeat domain-containing protein n=1 Tax=Pseudomonas citrulli TaxID=3064347 RepID=A0ABT9BSS1_9PSED|nr:hypothetical protein [Pseudomonas sp. K18]MDO7895595.1 hypothetical protein [Pseudomonas sp. K18]